MNKRTTVDAMKDVLTERERQEKLWGEQNHSILEWIPILMEEVGEVNEAIYETVIAKVHRKGHKGGIDNIRKEMVQVAAVALQIVECIDRIGIDGYKPVRNFSIDENNSRVFPLVKLKQLASQKIFPVFEGLPKADRHSSEYGLMETQIINGCMRSEGEQIPTPFYYLSPEEIVERTLETIELLKSEYNIKMLRKIDIEEEQDKLNQSMLFLYIRVFFEPKNKEDDVIEK